MGKIVGSGQAWIAPIGSTDFVPVTRDVLSFEHDGALHLAQPLGHVTADGLTPDLQPYLDVIRGEVQRTVDASGVPLHLLLGEPGSPAED